MSLHDAVKSAKGKVAVEPFPDMSVKTETVRAPGAAVGVTRIESKAKIQMLNIIWDSECGRFKRESRVGVKASAFATPWAKEVFEYGGKSFILMPDTFVELISEI